MVDLFHPQLLMLHQFVLFRQVMCHLRFGYTVDTAAVLDAYKYHVYLNHQQAPSGIHADSHKDDMEEHNILYA